MKTQFSNLDYAEPHPIFRKDTNLKANHNAEHDRTNLPLAALICQR